MSKTAIQKTRRNRSCFRLSRQYHEDFHKDWTLLTSIVDNTFSSPCLRRLWMLNDGLKGPSIRLRACMATCSTWLVISPVRNTTQHQGVRERKTNVPSLLCNSLRDKIVAWSFLQPIRNNGRKKRSGKGKFFVKNLYLPSPRSRLWRFFSSITMILPTHLSIWQHVPDDYGKSFFYFSRHLLLIDIKDQTFSYDKGESIIVLFLPSGASHNRHAAAMAPADAPDTFFRYKSGAYLKQDAFCCTIKQLNQR